MLLSKIFLRSMDIRLCGQARHEMTVAENRNQQQERLTTEGTEYTEEGGKTQSSVPLRGLRDKFFSCFFRRARGEAS